MSKPKANGLSVHASQRSQFKPTTVRNVSIGATEAGNLNISCSIGAERGTRVDVYLSLEEIMEWLPVLLGKAKTAAIRKAHSQDADSQTAVHPVP